MNIRMKLSFEACVAEAKKTTSKESCLKCFQEWGRIEFRDQRVKVTDEVRDQVVELGKDDETVTDISATTGISQPTVRKILKKAGIKWARSR